MANRLLCGLGLLFVGACVSVPSTIPESIDIDMAPVHEIFELEGRLAVKHSREGYSASFTWTQTGPEYVILLWGPLGQGRTLIKGNSSFIEITTADGVKHSDDHPERLMQRWLGWSIPLDFFKYWIQGRPGQVGGVDILKDESGSFEQLNWRISPSRYRVLNNTWMPMKTVAVNENLRITLIIRKANFGKSQGSLDSRVYPHQNSRLPRWGDLYVVDLQANMTREFIKY